MHVDYVIIGNGIAGIRAARAIRERDPAGRIAVLGEEDLHPYNRIMLSKQLLQSLNPETMLLQSRDWYREMNIALHNNSRATRLDLDNQQVILSDGQTLGYDRLLIATGARNRVPPVTGIDSPGVFSIRRLADVQAMQDSLHKSRRVVLIGGGIQNMETAWTLVQKGKEVVLVEAAQRLMPRLLDDESSQMLLQSLKKAGVTVQQGAWMERIEVGQALACILSSGEKLIGDLVLYATGIVPRADLAMGTPLSAGEGIGVDARLQTAVAHVYAAGDVTQCQGMVCGLWNTAAEQGRIAGLNMAGGSEEYAPALPVTTLNAFGVSLFSMGQPFVRDGGRTMEDRDREQNRYVRIFIEADRLVGAIVINDRSVIPVIRTALEKGFPIPEHGPQSVRELLQILQQSSGVQD